MLTQRPDGRPQCIACNLCATVCPAKVIEIEAGFDPDDPAHPKYPVRFEIDYSRCVFCGLCVEACPEDAIRMVQGSARTCRRTTATHMWLTLDELLTWNPQQRRRQALSGEAAASDDSEDRRMIETLLLYLFAGSALAGAALMLRAAPPDARRARAHRDDALARPASTRCSACTSSRSSRC